MKGTGRALSLLLVLCVACDDKSDDEAAKPQLEPPPAPTRVEPAETLRHAVSLARNPDDEAGLALKRLVTAGGEAGIWAIFGLGQYCQRGGQLAPEAAVTALAGWVAESKGLEPLALHTAARTIGSCGGQRAEELLRSWLSASPDPLLDHLVDASATGLGTLADRSGSLSERTQTALLDAAERESSPYLLYPLGRLRRLSPAVGARVLEVAGALVTGAEGPHRRHAIFALGSSGPEAALPLGQILVSDDYLSSERTAAAQALGRLGGHGQRALDDTVRQLLERGLPQTPSGEGWTPLRAALEELEEPAKSARRLREIATVVLPEGDEATTRAQRRRLLWLRCRAADLVARVDVNHKALEECDPDGGSVQALARLRVLERAPIENKRLDLFEKLASDSDPVVAQSALRMIPTHPEIASANQLLLDALTSESAGTRALGSQIIAAYPARAHAKDEEGGPDAKIVAAIQELLKNAARTPPETIAAALDAAGALGALTLKPVVEEICDSDREALHAPASRALALLGSPKRHCPQRKQQKSPKAPEPVPALERETPPVTIEIQSDVGPLTLHLDDPASAASRAHVLGLVERGFYDGLTVHAVTPGFAAQFGDPDGDGYADRVPPGLPNEVAPTPMGPFSVGMSSFAPGTQNTQLFVTLSDAPQLTGKRVRLGRAEGPWHLLVPGDRLHQVRTKKTGGD